jgi:hypothetical protein
MNIIKKPVALIVLAGISLVLAACDHSVNATVSTGDFGKIKSDFGLLNVPKFGLGTVLVLDPNNKVAQKIIVSPPANPSTPEATAREKFEIVKEVSFTVNLDAEVPEAVKVGITGGINSSTNFVLYNQKRLEVLDPIGEIMANPKILERVSAVPSEMFLVYVHALELADSIDISLAREAGGSTSVNVLKYGDYTVNVKYSDTQRIKGISAKGGAWFWKPFVFKYNSATKTVEQDYRKLDVYEYDYVAAK